MISDAALREATGSDLPEVLGLNEAAVPVVNSLDLDRLVWFTQAAVYFRVAEVEGKIAGFLIAVDDQCPYPSQYFQWFRERYARFIYVDRIVVAGWARGQRLGWRLYEDLERYAAGLDCMLTSDVYSDPPNDISLAFHHRFGFQWVGTHRAENDTKEVAKFLKPTNFWRIKS